MRRFFEMSWLDFKGQRAAFSLEEFLLLDTLYPFLTMAFYVVMASYAYHTSDVTDWVIGNSMLLCVNICIFSLGTGFMSERRFGRIRSILASPLHKLLLLLQKGFFSCLASVLTTLLGLGAGCIVFGVSFRGVSMVSLLVALLIAMFAATGFGLFLSALGLISDQMHLILNTMNYILLIFTGSNFPVSQLPIVVRFFSNCLPLTHSMVAARQIMRGGILTNPSVCRQLCLEGLVGACFYVLAALLLRFAEKKAIRDGSYDLF